MAVRFLDRREAGLQLAEALAHYSHDSNAIVLALPRGGVPVGYEVARQLHVPLDVFVVRKLGTPWQPELAMGAIASGGIEVINEDVVRALRISPSQVEAAVVRETLELERRERHYRGEREPTAVRDRTAILVDDGIATGSTMRAAIAALRRLGAARIVVAVPVASPRTCAELEEIVDEMVCLHAPASFEAVGAFYYDFSQTTDAEVRACLVTQDATRPRRTM
jgi:putative phosphoribosyl transferase